MLFLRPRCTACRPSRPPRACGGRPLPFGAISKALACRQHSADLRKLLRAVITTREAWSVFPRRHGRALRRCCYCGGCPFHALLLATLCGEPGCGARVQERSTSSTRPPRGPEVAPTGKPGQEQDFANLDLTNRYAAANGNPAAMRELVNESRNRLAAVEPVAVQPQFLGQCRERGHRRLLR